MNNKQMLMLLATIVPVFLSGLFTVGYSLTLSFWPSLPLAMSGIYSMVVAWFFAKLVFKVRSRGRE